MCPGDRVSEEGCALAGFDLVHARLLRCFPELVAELRHDAAPLLRACGIDPAAMLHGGAAISYRQTAMLLERAAQLLDCPDFGLRLAARQGGAWLHGALGAAMRNSRSLGDALRYVQDHVYAHSLAARIHTSPFGEDGSILSAHDILVDQLPIRSQAIEQILLLGHLNAMEITGGRARVRKVLFRHQPLSPLKTYRRHFGCEVRFGQQVDGVVFSAQDLACPIPDPDDQIYAKATSFIDCSFPQHAPPVHAQVRGIILQHFGTEDCNNERVAEALNLHPRTLHRRLREEGKSFRQIKDEVRREVALYYLRQTDLDLTRIAEKLGYAEHSVLTRSCIRWFAQAPRNLRSALPAGNDVSR